VSPALISCSGLLIFSLSQHVRIGPAQMFSEFVATFGLLAVIQGCSRRNPSATPYAVGAYITAAYWFTASTSFANPAVTVARAVSDTFSGIRPADVSSFLVAQAAGAVTATAFFGWLLPGKLRGEHEHLAEAGHDRTADLQRAVSVHRKLGA
jgi:glycerol uptake facilitator-like aquaporin